MHVVVTARRADVYRLSTLYIVPPSGYDIGTDEVLIDTRRLCITTQ